MVEKKYQASVIAPRIGSFLGAVLKHSGLQLTPTVGEMENPHQDFENPDVVVRFAGPDVPELLANKAELLLALEHLTMEVLRMPSEDHSRLCFDAQDYRMLRIEELRLSAQTAAEKVMASGVPFQFNPMNSRERRIIHLALRNETEVRSESSGSGPFRHVVIYPAGMPSPPEGALPPKPSFRRRR